MLCIVEKYLSLPVVTSNFNVNKSQSRRMKRLIEKTSGKLIKMLREKIARKVIEQSKFD